MEASLFVPGLNTGLKDEDYEKSRQVYNDLADDTQLDDDSGKVIEQHLPYLFRLLDQHNLLESFGFHSAHNHYPLDVDTVQFGIDGEVPVYRRTKPTPVGDLREGKVHGHIFVVSDTGLQPYEFQIGEAPEFPHSLNQFLQLFIKYVEQNQLQSLIGLEVRDMDSNRPDAWECFFDNESVMMDGKTAAELGYRRGRTTGWVGIKQVEGNIKVCGKEYHVTWQGKERCFIDQNKVAT